MASKESNFKKIPYFIAFKLYLRDNLLEYYSILGAMDMWERQLIETKNGQFEIFVAGEGEPLCITHL